MDGWFRRLRRRRLYLAAILGIVAAVTFAIVATASHPEVSLPGSDFEIDTDANLKVDDPTPPSLDWANVAETRATDEPTGATDDSFGNGTKEDTAVPSVVNGSIPPNKSDLLHFGVYMEENAVGHRFLHMFWHRVQEPTGTTNMDFEFNKSSTTSSNGVTPVRSEGDLLIQYDLAQGGTHPELFLSEWEISGTASQVCEAANKLPCWGKRVNLSGANLATGSINTSPIPSADAEGLGDISPRTFGEATVDFDAITGGGCAAFGSAYLKSRSSDSFTSALKDFIAPAPLNISSCGAIKLSKTRKHAADGTGDHPHAGVGFTLKQGTTTVDTGTTDSNGEICWDGLEQGSYTVVETVPTGYKSDAAGNTPANSKSVTVDTEASCDDDPYAGNTVSFANTPLSNITVSFTSQVTGGTASQISCTGLTADPADSTPSAFDDTSETFKDLVPGTYTCTVVVDP
jgi:hypothetical protein